MKLIIGLGNPGPEYQNTRHNFGFMALDHFQAEAGFPAWQEKFQSLASEGQINNEKIILAKPQTFMNLSGQAVRTIAAFYKIPAADILVVHDDIDLPLGALRLAQNSGSAGHNGIRSIIENLGTQNFSRLRLGIKTEKAGSFWKLFKRSIPAEKFVLQNFSAAEKPIVEEITKKSGEVIRLITEEGMEKAQNKFN